MDVGLADGFRLARGLGLGSLGLGLEPGSGSELGLEPHFSVAGGRGAQQLPRLSKLVRFGADESSMGLGFGFGL